MNAQELAKYIDLTALKATTLPSDIDALCAEARRYSFAAVCINPCYVERSVKALAGTDVAVATVIGFPLGAMTSAAKAAEARDAVLRGAHEIDMVINVGLLKAGEHDAVQADISAVVAATVGAAAGAIVKVIIETCYLTDDEKVTACRLSVAAGAHFVKTSTGFGTAGATIEDVQLMRATVGPTIGVKAAGGIRTTDAALAMIAAGASRLGASSGIKLLEGLSGGAL